MAVTTWQLRWRTEKDDIAITTVFSMNNVARSSVSPLVRLFYLCGFHTFNETVHYRLERKYPSPCLKDLCHSHSERSPTGACVHAPASVLRETKNAAYDLGAIITS